MIDVGGPALLRAAAKNFASVTVVCRAAATTSRCSRSCGRGAARRRPSSGDGSPRSRSRDGRLRGRDRALVPARRRLPGDVRAVVRPRARAPVRREPAPARGLLRRARRAHASPRARRAAPREAALVQQPRTTSPPRGCSRASSTGPACVIVKHANPCGVAVADTIEEAYAKALAADPVSAYGGVVVLNRAGDRPRWRTRSRSSSSRCCSRPAYDAQALEALAGKPALRVLDHTERRARRRGRARLPPRPRRPARPGSRRGTAERERWRSSAARSPSDAVGRPALRVARREARRLERDRARAGGQTLGIGAGQMSRVDAVRIALEKARELGHDARRRRARLGRVLPVRRRAAARARRRRRRDHPAGRLEARRRGDRGGARRGRGDGLHGPPALPALMATASRIVRR